MLHMWANEVSTDIYIIIAQNELFCSLIPSFTMLYVDIVWRETFERENLHEFREFSAIRESFLHEIFDPRKFSVSNAFAHT